MDKETLLQELAKLIADMAFDFDRFSQSGQVTYAKICAVLAMLTDEEVQL